MASDARGGRPLAERPKRRQVGFRVDDALGELFDAAVEAAAKDAPAGMTFTASDYLRGLFLRDAEARGLTGAKTKPTKRAPRRSGKGAAP